MAIKTPTINRIIRMTEFDQLRTAKTPGNMYLCLDSFKMYYDESASKRVEYSYVGVKTVNDLYRNITPEFGRTYYCWEDNSLWLWMNKWISLWTDNTYPSAYSYDNDSPSQVNPGALNAVYRYDQPNLPADDNGLLKDGSVIIRDRNRIIKGKLYVDDSNDNLVISSFLGGGLRILPNGLTSTEGELFIGDDGKSIIRSELSHLNNETYVDYSERPDLDKSEYPRSDHKYKIFHEGNLDASAVRILTPEELYNKLRDTSLPDVLDLNVKYISGKDITDLALSNHTHTASSISDFATEARRQAQVEVRSSFNTLVGEGVTVLYDAIASNFKISADSFNLSVGGGAIGSVTVEHLTDATLNLTVDPNKHIHKDLVDDIALLRSEVSVIKAMNPDDYYKKGAIDQFLSDVTGTDIPTSGKPLLVNSDGILPGVSASANKLNGTKNIIVTGDITGTTSTDFSSDTTINLSASNILSDAPEAGKALKVDSNGNLPANAITSSALNHLITFNITGDVSGTGIIDTTRETFTIDTSIVGGDILLTEDEIGVKIPGLDENGKIPTTQLPDIMFKESLLPMGTFDPNDGLPSENPVEGNFWIAGNAGTVNNEEYKSGDWILYINSSWVKVNTTNDVYDVNGKEGHVVLTYTDVGAISAEYIDYTLGDTIPGNKLVRTSTDGVILGASVAKLSQVFNVTSTEDSMISIDIDSGVSSTDGSNPLNLKFDITQSGYQNIFQNVGYAIQNNGISIPYQNTINFLSGFKVVPGENGIEISSSSGANAIAMVYWNGEQDTNFLDELTVLYRNRKTTPIILITAYHQNIFYYLINENYADITSATTITIEPDHYIVQASSLDNGLVQVFRELDKLQITFIVSEGDAYVDSLSVATDNQTMFEALTTSGSLNTLPYLPVFDANPATKKYVDDKVKFYGKYTSDIGDASSKSFTVKHNLDSEDVIVIVRHNGTKEQILVSNTIIDGNTVRIDLDEVIDNDELNVTIIKL